MITAEQIMAGKLPTSKRVFKVKGVGDIELHRLPAADEVEARILMQDRSADPEKLQKVAERNIYYMLNGKFNAKEAKKINNLMDVTQLANVYAAGLFYIDLEQDNLEAIEKN